MGCASSVPPPTGGASTQEGVANPATGRQRDSQKSLGGVAPPPAAQPAPSAVEAKYYKGNIDKETTSLFCDDDGCGTVVTTTNEIPEDATSAHRYVDFVARERRSIAQSAAEPSAFATAISHKYRVARAYVKYGITGDVHQYQDEVDKAVPIFSTRARNRVWEWLRNVVQAPPRGTRVEVVKMFKRVQRGSVMSLSGSNQPDVKRSASLSRITLGGPESKSGLGHLIGSGPVNNFADDVLDEILMGSSNVNNSPATNKDLSIGKGESNAASPCANTAEVPGEGHAHNPEGSISAMVNMAASADASQLRRRGDVKDEAPFALPSNFGLIAESFAVGTVIGMEGDHQYDLIVVEEEAEVIDDENDPQLVQAVDSTPPALLGGDALLSPHMYNNQYLNASTSSHRDTTSSLNSKERFDYMSVSQHSLQNNPDGGVMYDGAAAHESVPRSGTGHNPSPDEYRLETIIGESPTRSTTYFSAGGVRVTGRSVPRPPEVDADVDDMDSDPIYQSIRAHNAATLAAANNEGDGEVKDDATSPKIEKLKSWMEPK